MLSWFANQEVQELLEVVKNKHHVPRLADARIAVCFEDSKPFVGDRFNWGRVRKFSQSAKLFHPDNKKYDFAITLCADAWVSVLDAKQREALLDLRLECCQVEYVPVTTEENGKKHVVKDEWGRVQYTNEFKMDDDGPKWKVIPLDLNVYQANVSRYGCWCSDLLDFKNSLLK